MIGQLPKVAIVQLQKVVIVQLQRVVIVQLQKVVIVQLPKVVIVQLSKVVIVPQTLSSVLLVLDLAGEEEEEEEEVAVPGLSLEAEMEAAEWELRWLTGLGLAVLELVLGLDVEPQVLAAKGVGSGMVASVLPLNIKPKNNMVRWMMDV